MKRKKLVEAIEPIEEKVREGDIIILNNTKEFFLCIISYIYHAKRIIGIIVSGLNRTTEYNMADTIEFSERNILSIVLKNE